MKYGLLRLAAFALGVAIMAIEGAVTGEPGIGFAFAMTLIIGSAVWPE